MERNYEVLGARESAARIVSECIRYGKSTGWCGGATFDDVEKICNAYNVRYVDDFNGTWALRSRG